MENKWESLDVDDSDLPSLTLLRPCSNSNKHHHHHHTPAPRFIPGPAGKLQAAMNRKRPHHSDPPISTQEPQCPQLSYQDDDDNDDDDDDDFKANSWLHALHFLNTAQSIPTTPLACIDTSLPGHIVNQVVAIIDSCTPNGLGDMMVTLKDPSGIRDGTIHRKVLTVSEFAKDISAKAAIILKKVSIFAPSSKTVYLNITGSNVVKVFRKDVAQLSGNIHVAAPRVTYLSPEFSKKSRIVEDEFAQKQGRTEETMHEVSQVAIAGRSWLLNNQNKNRLSFTASGNDEICGDKNNGTQNKALRARQSLAATDKEEGVDVVGDNQVMLDSNEKQPTSDNLSEGHKSSVLVGNLDGDHSEEVQQADKAVKQRSNSKVSLPQWTDEQLLELFNDDEPLF